MAWLFSTTQLNMTLASRNDKNPVITIIRHGSYFNNKFTTEIILHCYKLLSLQEISEGGVHQLATAAGCQEWPDSLNLGIPGCIGPVRS